MSQHLVRCPNGHIGRVDDEQLAGEVSLDCTGNYGECDFHGFIDDEGVEIVEEDWRE